MFWELGENEIAATVNENYPKITTRLVTVFIS